MKYLIHTCLLLLFIFGCQSETKVATSEIDDLIETLWSNELKKEFLEKVMDDDQKVRGEEGQQIMLKYGKGSKEDWAYIKRQWHMDSINLLKIEKYLEHYGHPTKKGMGKTAAVTPWIVIHHQTDEAIRDQYFEVLYKAYLNGDLKDSAFTMYLGRSYEFKFRERHQMESPYTIDDQVNQLIEKLGLKERQQAVLSP